MTAELLIENYDFTLSLEEDKERPGKFIARGEIARHDRPTSNRRFYGEHLWRREIGRLTEAMSERKVFGELDHPADGRTKLTRVSHLMTGMKVESDGKIVGEMEVLDTPNGRILKSILESGAKVGVSSRGFGSTKKNASGFDEVQEDFKLDTFDFVADPATKTAYPEVFQEETARIPEDDDTMTLEDLKKNYPGLVEELTRSLLAEKKGSDVAPAPAALVEAEQRTEERLKSKFASELRRHTESIYEEAHDRAFSQLMSDPEVAGARQICERIFGMVQSFGPADNEAMAEKDKKIEALEQKLADRELEVQKAESQTREMAKLVKEASYTLHVERALAGSPASESIRKLVGDVTQYKSVAEIDERIDALRSDLEEAGVITTKSDDDSSEVDERISDLEARVEAAEERARKAEHAKEEALTKARRAADIAEDAMLQAHVERTLSGNKDKKLRAVCEEAASAAEVDRLVAGWNPSGNNDDGGGRFRVLDEDEADRIRARVGRGKQRSLQEDTFGSRGANGSNGRGGPNPLQQFGLTTEEFDNLSGTTPGDTGGN